ncbi:hypothetical protein Tco_0143951 [Tanacetum coccineum]
MAANQAIEYAPQCGDLTVESLVFHNNNVVVLRTLDFRTFTESTGLNYYDGTYVSHPSAKAVKTELAKIVENPILLDRTPVLKTAFPVAWRILFNFVIEVLSKNYSFTEQINSIQQLLAYCLLTRIIPSLNRSILFTMIFVSTSFFYKKKKGKSQIMNLTLPKSQGHEASRALSMKRNKPKSKKTTPETQVTPPSVQTEDSKKTQSVSSGQTAHPQDTYGNIQPVVKRFHSPLDEGTRKSQPLPEGTTSDPKDLGGNVQPTYKGLPSIVSDEGTSKTKPLPEGPHGDKDSEGFKPPADMEPSTTPVADLSGTHAKYQVDQTQFTRLRNWSLTKNKGEPSYEGELGNQSLILSTTADVQSLLLSNEELMEEKDQSGKHEEATASYADLRSEIEGFHDAAYKVHKDIEAAFSINEKLLVKFQAQYGKDAEKILGSLKVIHDAIKQDLTLNKKVIEDTKAYIKISTNLT